MVVENSIPNRRFLEAIEYFRNNTSEEDTVIVIPEGGSINFFAERKNPVSRYTLAPPVFDIYGEETVISEFREADADYIVLVQRDNTEHGARAFGIDYAKRLEAWIKGHYELVRLIGPYPFTAREYGIAIFKKK